jgi:hypothetical protein
MLAFVVNPVNPVSNPLIATCAVPEEAVVFDTPTYLKGVVK